MSDLFERQQLYDTMRRKTEETHNAANIERVNTQIDLVATTDTIIADHERATNVITNAPTIIHDIHTHFEKETELNETDVIFLFLATALQCARQYLLGNEKLKFSNHDQGNDLFKKLSKPEWHEVLFQSVPYDISKKGIHMHDTEIAGSTHRYRTLGHDPVLGWIFGTANIMTNSLTKHNFETFQVNMQNKIIVRHYPNGCLGMLKKAADYSQTDTKLLAASVARQAIHFGTDVFTKQGLPIPFISTINNEIAKDMLTKWHIDTWSITKGAGLSALINNLIFCIHQLFYDEKKDIDRKIYEVRTRRILRCSNVLATSSNLIVTAFTKNVELLDIGGMIETLHRMISDSKYINDIKTEFLEKELSKKIYDENYYWEEL